MNSNLFLSDSNRLILGDNLLVIRQLPSESIDLIYIDPPYFSNKKYYVITNNGEKVCVFSDIWEGGMPGYLIWLSARLYEIKRLLKRTGSIYVHLDWHASHYVRVEMDKIFGPDTFQNEFIWYYSGGGASKKRWARKHDTILLYTRSATNWTFNVDDVRQPYKWTDGQRRADGSGRDLEKGKLPDDVFECNSEMPWSKNRVGYPTEKPTKLLERLILASSNEGDTVADFFCGGGITPFVAQRLGRRWIACDQSPISINITSKRIVQLMKKTGSLFPTREFIVECLDENKVIKEMYNGIN